MKTKSRLLSFIIILVVAVGLISYGINSYNGLVVQEENVENAWGNVQTQYQKRMDLIPNLVNTTKGYAAHEKETLEGVINARSKATQVTIDPTNLTPEAMKQYSAAQGEVSQALSRLLVTVERYPDLKANQNFLALQNQLETIEDQISVERKTFNERVTEFNKYMRVFPRVMVARIFGFSEKVYFEAEAGSEKAPRVEF
ncbi:LemA family protein [Porphyromonas cangingivalis]|uniref:LemA family protein n=1 Tax=Porphyromonas cangingivalis TaxID=36874 RepID=A0A0A2EQM7_PORCN|nr:LemA family protein [Porphyromonas cangingivalis]KGN81161.1 LemA family protein [Porphyromonas cangingivalis]SJZ51516.1 LemA protein [Porphyromonas cangingivalis]SPY34431.1 LemA family [Porphyromonas cangingivalis]VEJ02066.1 LemA family [Porphyromonas cangingivalis]